MKELTLIPIIVIIILYICRHQVNRILDTIWTSIRNRIHKINFNAQHYKLYSI